MCYRLIVNYVEEIVVSCCKINSFNLYGGSDEEEYNSNSKSPDRIPVRCVPKMKQSCEPRSRVAVYESGTERRICYVRNLDTKQQNYFALFGKYLCLCPTCSKTIAKFSY